MASIKDLDQTALEQQADLGLYCLIKHLCPFILGQ